jgi:hypothetical protein
VLFLLPLFSWIPVVVASKLGVIVGAEWKAVVMPPSPSVPSISYYGTTPSTSTVPAS